jgi:AcrR family transcriptional regulator
MNEAEQKIFISGKKSFYEKGYYKSTVRDIANSAGVNSGLFNYYFKNKNNLAKLVYSNIYHNIEKLAREYFGEEESPVILMGIIIRMHNIILFDDKFINFGMDAVKEGIYEESIFEEARETVIEVIRHFDRTMFDDQINLLLAIKLASEKTLSTHKYLGSISYDLQRISEVSLKIFLNGFDLENKEIVEVSREVNEKFMKFYSDTPNFVNQII